MNDSGSFGTWLKQRRKALDLTQHDLARQVGCSVATIRKIEANERRPSRQVAERIALCLEIGPVERPRFLRAAREGVSADLPARSDGSAQAAPERRPHNLPAQPTPLIGREQDIVAVSDMLRSGMSRLLTLSGPAGVGKTRLALQVAERMHPHFAHGVFWVALAAIDNPDLVAATIAQALGVVKTSGRSLLECLIAALRERALLLLLDNFEQVVAAAPLIAELLEACPQIAFLVTSRVRLRLRWEQQYPVAPLALPDPRGRPPLDEIAAAPAVALFVDRARAVQPDFALTPANVAAITSICAHLDGLPLAIELVAARSDVLPPEEMLARLDSRFTLLRDGPHDLPARHQTLWDALEWSYRILDQEQQTLLVRLGVFVGGWTIEAAMAVCEPEGWPSDRGGQLYAQVLRGMTALLNHSLISRWGQPDAARFIMLETIHEYALERLEAGTEAETIRRYHAHYYTGQAEQAEPLLAGMDQQRWLGRLDDDHDNMRAALRWAITRGETTLALRLCGALGRFWFMRDHFQEGSAWLAQALGLEQPPAADPARAKALNVAGVLAWAQGECAQAESRLTQSLPLYEALGDTSGVASVLNNLANIARDRCDYARAGGFYEQSLALHRALGNRNHIASSLHNLALVASHQGDDARAADLLEESLAQRRALGDQWGIAAALNDLGVVACRRHDPRARRLLEESLALFQELGDRRYGAHALHRLGRLACQQGDLPRAMELCADSLAICRELEDREGIVECLEVLASVAGCQGRSARAAQLWGAAEALRDQIGVVLPPGDSRAHQGSVASARAALGTEPFDIAWSIGRTIGLERAIANALEDRG